MVRVAWVLLAVLPGCSLILDFSDKAIPIDAEVDAPYTQEQCDLLEPNDDPTTAMMIATGMEVGPAAICAPPKDSGLPADVDFYKFTVPTGTTKVTITMTYTARPGGDIDIELYNAMATPPALSASREFTGNEKIVCPGASPSCMMLTPADYLLKIIPSTAGQVNTYTFTVMTE